MANKSQKGSKNNLKPRTSDKHKKGGPKTHDLAKAKGLGAAQTAQS